MQTLLGDVMGSDTYSSSACDLQIMDSIDNLKAKLNFGIELA